MSRDKAKTMLRSLEKTANQTIMAIRSDILPKTKANTIDTSKDIKLFKRNKGGITFSK